MLDLSSTWREPLWSAAKGGNGDTQNCIGIDTEHQQQRWGWLCNMPPPTKALNERLSSWGSGHPAMSSVLSVVTVVMYWVPWAGEENWQTEEFAKYSALIRCQFRFLFGLSSKTEEDTPVGASVRVFPNLIPTFSIGELQLVLKFYNWFWASGHGRYGVIVKNDTWIWYTDNPL